MGAALGQWAFGGFWGGFPVDVGPKARILAEVLQVAHRLGQGQKNSIFRAKPRKTVHGRGFQCFGNLPHFVSKRRIGAPLHREMRASFGQVRTMPRQARHERRFRGSWFQGREGSGRMARGRCQELRIENTNWRLGLRPSRPGYGAGCSFGGTTMGFPQPTIRLLRSLIPLTPPKDCDNFH